MDGLLSWHLPSVFTLDVAGGQTNPASSGGSEGAEP